MNARSELFESIVMFEEYELDAALRRQECALWDGGLLRTVPAHYPLTLVGFNKPALSLRITYDCVLIGSAFATRLAEHFQVLLQEALANPE